MEGLDLSHLTEGERVKILNVMARQKLEEDRDQEIFKKSEEEVKLLEAAIRLRSREKRDELESTCHICAKTKFADGVGHICSTCGIRCCARCGVKVVQRSNKIFWLCILCRKKKEIKFRFGQWVQNEQHKWGRARSLEEESEMRGGNDFPDPGMGRKFLSQVNITAPSPSSSIWQEDRMLHTDSPRQEGRSSISRREEFRPAPSEQQLRSAVRSGDEWSWSPSNHRRRSLVETVIRNDSLSSEQSENPPSVPGPLPRRRNGGSSYHRRSGSSESEDEARSTPSSCADSESDRVSLRKEVPRVHPRDSRRRSQEDYRPTTLHSVNWKLSKDGSHWLGHLVLHKDLLPDGRTRQNLGMKVVGGQELDRTRTFGAIVQNIREGSLADRVGHIRPGDEVLEWNGTPLRGKSKETVASIIALSKNDSQVQLVLTRRFGDPPPPLDPSELRRLPPPHLEVHPEALQRDPRYLRYSDRRTSHVPARSPDRSSIGGRIQVGLWYDQQNYQLIVTVVCAKDLPPRPDMSRRNPYIKIVLLPDKSEKNKRRSKTIAETNDPQFNQRFFFHHLRQTELRRSALQISAWDYDRRNAFSDFLGEVVISLGAVSLNDIPQWYTLSMHRDEAKACPEITPISPTGSRLSDEELSDYDEKFSAHTERRIMAVDCSSPFFEEDGRKQTGLPMGITPTYPQTSPMGERSRSLATASPMVEYPRGRLRETGLENRRRSRSMADPTSRRTPDYSSRSLSPPELRPQFQPMPRPSNAHRLLPPPNSFRKRQLPQVPTLRSDLEERFYKARNPAAATSSGAYSEYDRFVQRRGGGSRMAAALGVGTSSPLVSPERSDSECSSKFSLSSAFHRSSRTLGEFTGRSPAYGGPVHPSSREIDGSLSDTAVGLATESKAMIRRSTPTENSYAKRSPHLSKKSSSTSQLSVTGHKKRLIFRRRNGSSSSFVVQRSEEILPDVRAGSSISSDGSISGDSLTWGPRLPPEVGEASSFVEGLGPGQLVGRQALASPSLGDVQLGICERKNRLEVEVIRARGLQAKLGSKSSLPAPYVKVYLMDGRKCIAKQKTATARKTLDPLYQQQLVFPYDCQNCYLQVTVWGNYGGMEKKVFMGVAQIVLDDIDLAKGVIAWYKLFHHSSLVSSLAANERRSFLSLDNLS
ncbi:regulating synaptic membrane exocytosis protein 2-like isoform X3 [Stegodyphus dumicola]|uniref:regulating synaptic membrane exocytosis protein 2-like isoform X3 n=1 Tax=Stegodyphus dumicola TaxID=202533 RepID=UPI0015B1E4BC|nr:regulating synaptic membrane exocytosis protein 2-like isoform X3 [Stegodyphus dumicola]